MTTKTNHKLCLFFLSDYIDSVGFGEERERREEVVGTIKNYLSLVATPAKFITDDFLTFFSR